VRDKGHAGEGGNGIACGLFNNAWWVAGLVVCEVGSRPKSGRHSDVILDPDNYDVWLDPRMRSAAGVSKLLKPCEARMDVTLSRRPSDQPWPTKMRNAPDP